MQVSLEYLYHFRCDHCDQWWSRADIEPQINEITYCPYCGHHNLVEGIQTFRNAALANQEAIKSDQSDQLTQQSPESNLVKASEKTCLERIPDSQLPELLG